MTDYNDMGNETTSSQFIVYALHHSDSDHVRSWERRKQKQDDPK